MAFFTDSVSAVPPQERSNMIAGRVYRMNIVLVTLLCASTTFFLWTAKCQTTTSVDTHIQTLGWDNDIASDENLLWSKRSYIQPLARDGKDNGVRFVDINCDGLTDVAVHNKQSRLIRLNVGSFNPLQLEESPFAAFLGGEEFQFVDENGNDMGTRIGDFNRDGYPDLVYSRMGASGELKQGMHVSTVLPYPGTVVWQDYELRGMDGAPFVIQTDVGIDDMGIRLTDLNGDGYLDFIQNYEEDTKGKQTFVRRIWTGGCHELIHGHRVPQWQEVKEGSEMWTYMVSLKDIPPFTRKFFWPSWHRNGTIWIRLGDEILQIEKIGWQTASLDNGVRLFDINGDGADDIVQMSKYVGFDGVFDYCNPVEPWRPCNTLLFMNKPGKREWTLHDEMGENGLYLRSLAKLPPFVIWIFKYYDFTMYNGSYEAGRIIGGDQGIRAVDLNKDRLVDLVRLFYDEILGMSRWVCLNTGQAWDVSESSALNKKWNATLPKTGSGSSLSSECDCSILCRFAKQKVFKDLVDLEIMKNATAVTTANSTSGLALVDLTGDTIPDFVWYDRAESSSPFVYTSNTQWVTTVVHEQRAEIESLVTDEGKSSIKMGSSDLRWQTLLGNSNMVMFSLIRDAFLKEKSLVLRGENEFRRRWRVNSSALLPPNEDTYVINVKEAVLGK
jgi:hypothetical protein